MHGCISTIAKSEVTYYNKNSQAMAAFMWGCITTLGWMIQVGGSIALVYLVYKTIRLLLSDCDLTVKSKTLKAGYFKGRVVWVTGAASGSKCCMLYIT